MRADVECFFAVLRVPSGLSVLGATSHQNALGEVSCESRMISVPVSDSDCLHFGECLLIGKAVAAADANLGHVICQACEPNYPLRWSIVVQENVPQSPRSSLMSCSRCLALR